jgi:hypothetical protein
VYFKIHGSADDSTRQSLVFQLRHESGLPNWKRSLLRSIVRDKTLLLVGYSGLDFEICPEIPLLRPAQVLWNVLTESEITPNARMVLEKAGGEIVVGDMRRLLSVVFRPVSAQHGRPNIDIEAVVRSRFSESTLRLWRAKILNNLSYGKSALREIRGLLKEARGVVPIELLEEQARAFHYIGAYKRAARTYENIAKLATKRKLCVEDIYEELLSACDNWRSYGAFLKAAKRLREAEALGSESALTRGDLLAAAKLKRILLLRRNYQMAELLGAKRYKNRIRARAQVLFKSSAEALLTSGRWFELQQLRLWADRFDLPADATRPSGMYELPQPRHGYEHLAFPMAQMMVFRDELDTGTRKPDKETANGKSQSGRTPRPSNGSLEIELPVTQELSRSTEFRNAQKICRELPHVRILAFNALFIVNYSAVGFDWEPYRLTAKCPHTRTGDHASFGNGSGGDVWLRASAQK